MDGWEVPVRDLEIHRDELERLAVQILGSAEEAREAVETTRELLRHGHHVVDENTVAWLHMVTARTCYDMLRRRDGRRRTEPLLEEPAPEKAVADSVGVVLMAALDRLSPPERLAFVLHDVFRVPVDEIATIIGRSPADTGQLCRSARRRMHRLDLADVPPAAGTAAESDGHVDPVDQVEHEPRGLCLADRVVAEDPAELVPDSGGRFEQGD
jgi:DNA-directed RNA polymerase specialized sigma24 family protein